ncbi:ANTAR domain-containing protein [Microbacterium ulmi]|uniref:GAF and ANTAR domain-containing protein n=1 Tax=Microbacterium ulmi TaxID=179095 RepID=A0A7Y2Q1F3_9MICO|nr:GAF and ANTAR domain-containing protein [Microbacterium ulmi]NII69930.1 GAF domain-containing protein [Microbacterium ulmi]NNH03850.1 GAF and ANTAR domain-containing protein [Microbacterium ulmi]
MDASREGRLVDAFVNLADTLVADYDVVDLLSTLSELSRDLLAATDAGILLAGAEGRLEVVAASSERSHLISLMQLAADEGPCVDAYRTGAIVAAHGWASIYARWPQFATSVRELGYESVLAVPMRLRADRLGSLNLFYDHDRPASEEDGKAAQGLADVATISILHERALKDRTISRDQLQRALDSRVLIEQAKGIIAHSENVDMDEAFRRLRERARNGRERISEAARELITRSLSGETGEGRPSAPGH